MSAPRLAALLLSWTIAALGLAWLGGLAWFAAALPAAVADPATPTDAIVVLTGGHGRIEEGVALLRRGLAKKLFVSGVERGVEVPEMLKRAHLAVAPADAAIELGHDADSTVSNAAETALWMRAQGYGSLRLVTSYYHMPRSLLEFRHAMPGIAVIANPVFGPAAHGWWTGPEGIELVAGEYMKYLAAWASLEIIGDADAP